MDTHFDVDPNPMYLLLLFFGNNPATHVITINDPVQRRKRSTGCNGRDPVALCAPRKCHPGFGAALGDGEIASILSYIRKSWTAAGADVTADFVQEVRKGEEGVVGPYEAMNLWTTAGAEATCRIQTFYQSDSGMKLGNTVDFEVEGESPLLAMVVIDSVRGG